MESIKRIISAKRKRRYEPITISRGTTMIPIEFEIEDFTIPANSTASAVAVSHRTGAQHAARDSYVDNNTVTILPAEDMFDSGYNDLQFEITQDGLVLVSLIFPVVSDARLSESPTSSGGSTPSTPGGSTGGTGITLQDVTNAGFYKKPNGGIPESDLSQAVQTKLNATGGGTGGANGLSAYELAVQQGYTGTLDAWLASLKGDKGDKGDPGEGAGGAIPEDLDKIIEVTETQPTSPMNQAWVDPNSESIEVPSWEAFESLKDNISDLQDIANDDHINDLINTALGVIENGSY